MSAEQELLNKLMRISPSEIEEKSFSIITEELRGRTFPKEEEPIIKRVIHTTADFEYADSLVFSPGAVKGALEALRSGAPVVTDTNMGKAGINRKSLTALGSEVYCFMADEDVAENARSQGTTRAAASMDKAAALGLNGIYAIGNAPTALVRLYELIEKGIVRPSLVIGVPVGFVNVVAAKELILSRKDIPSIVARGRKGGSNVAAAICNALIYQVGRIK